MSYDSELTKLTDDFFEPVIVASSRYRVRMRSLRHESLLPVSLGLLRYLQEGHRIQILYDSLDPAIAPNHDASVSPPESREISGGLPQALQPLMEAAYREVTREIAALADQIEIKSFPRRPNDVVASKEPPGTVGFLTDESGASVSYHADWSTLAETESRAVLTASWTWGDPFTRVRRALERFDVMWNDSSSVLVADDTKKGLLAVLLHLQQHPTLTREVGNTFQLFRHQQTAIDEWLRRGCRGVFKMCTGSGKTVSALACVRELAKVRRGASQRVPPVIVSVPTRVLADQWIGEIRRFGFSSVVTAYNAFDQWNQVLEPSLRAQTNGPRFVVTTYRTFADERFVAKIARTGESGVEAVWIADEMHNLSSSRLREIMKRVEGLFPFRLGLSATPEIEGDLSTTEYLLQYFGGICASYELSDGIRDGVLCPYRYYPTPAYLAPELGERYLGLLRQISDARGGSTALMNAYRESRDLIRTSGVQVARFRDLVQSLVDSGSDLRHTLIYCPPGYGSDRELSDEIDTDQSERRLIEEVIEILREYGFSASSILGETPSDQRAEILRRFADGRLNTLCAIGCLDEGIDVPSIQRAIVLYSIDREKQFIQRRGRILRQPKGVLGKIAEIYDIVILPQGSLMPAAQATTLLTKELRRYHQFARLALNREDADVEISGALSIATKH